MTGISIARVEVSTYRVPVTTPVMTSFGAMTNRPAVFVRLTDAEGAFGWGEIFANWPAAGAEHRARLLMEDIADLVIGFRAEAASDLFQHLMTTTHIRALQCGEWGPFAQVIAGLDTALHDLFARRKGVSLAFHLNPDAARAVPAYASGIHIGAAHDIVPRVRQLGYRAMKVKIGFHADTDLTLLRALCAGRHDGERLFADANQAWDLRQALRFVAQAGDLGLGWLEEPIRADMPAGHWAELANSSRIKLAAGENITGFDDFDAAIEAGHLGFIQPDVAKWGGITGCHRIGQAIRAGGRTYCPHFLGGGIGLIASGHLLAAVGSDGLLEVDINTNPLRDAFFPDGMCKEGVFAITDAPGLGFDELPESLARYRTLDLVRH
ncbi:mandelate racemase/muconate lactonizing enzyme family protein [Hoeflea sp. YIM 152468]|uniref:mandelate racemase/muconate lactonizing enzyme family protein n=1 Tax=Hoeflea sp. YIM 152468 TaxID=3031759 RepID=UPI0023DCC31B|nr:mandelate racemase/muconate lactonizing enzyme family protein [Hoeflea sp. YIM 152468]MDF1609817.1 mandelate racemase/muconate lactonizing enzyme family protein [Hoeflea sp. YIM 152468]